MNNVACVYLKVVAHQQRKKHDKQTNKPKNCVFFILWFKMSNASMYISLLNSMAIFKICTIFTAHFTRRVSRLPLIHEWDACDVRSLKTLNIRSIITIWKMENVTNSMFAFFSFENFVYKRFWWRLNDRNKWNNMKYGVWSNPFPLKHKHLSGPHKIP